MTIPVITEQELADLANLAADLNVSDDERRAVLLENSSRDINAAPGSGKTTLLAAKLLLLGKKWPHERKGICVLSHTNVAREEIQRRLGSTVEGSRLLAYPNFIGTIHALVNQFLALPCLRSKGLTVDIIDDEVFRRRAIAIAKSNWGLRTLMEKNPRVAPMIEGLVYRGPNLEVDSEGGKLPGTDAKTRPFILKIKQTLTDQGIYRYGDMFAYAEHLLANSPHLRTRLSLRFPIVFIDEMQDTSWDQERLLQLMFDDSVVIQRFGDVNQRILGNEAGAENLTFPMEGALPISTSMRFGPAIAKAVAGVQLGGTSVTGENADHHSPMLMTYSTAHAGKVISAFGLEVLNRFDDTLLRTGAVTALCARKQGDAQKALPGRTLLDYWPNFVDETKVIGPRIEQFWSLMSGQGRAQQDSGTLVDRTSDVRRAILMVLRAAGAEVNKDIRDGNQLFRRLRDAGFDVTAIRLLIRNMIFACDLTATEAKRKQIPVMLFYPLQKLLPPGMTLADFEGLPIFAEAEAPLLPAEMRKVCSEEHDGRRIDVHIGSIASMKGETHLATLILESYGWPGRRFDVEEALPVIAGLSVRDPKLKESHLSQYRNLYVGMSRPTSFLCLAANAERVSDECKTALVRLGWIIKSIG